MATSFKPVIQLLRPSQWLKNLFIFLPVLFALKIRETDRLLANLEAFFAFSFVASFIYIINDWRDIEEDRQHPKKKYRPLAAGTVPVAAALGIGVFFLVLGAALSFSLPAEAQFILAGYLILNLGYSLGLKHIPLLDIFIISVGFLLRIFIGGISAGVPVTMWIILITFLLAMFLALSKRREDVLALLDGKATRKSVQGYSLEFVNTGMMLLAPVTVMAYISYSISSEVITRLGSENLYLTVIFVVLGFLRYLQVIMVEKQSTNPTDILLKDRFLQIIIAGWLLTFLFLIYKPLSMVVTP